MPEFKLNELRRYAISTRNIVRYRDPQGREAVVSYKGTVEIPGISGQPPYNIEEVFGAAVEFQLEPWTSSMGASEVKAPTKLSPEQMAAEVKKHLPASARAGRAEAEEE